MVHFNYNNFGPIFVFLLLPLFSQFHSGFSCSIVKKSNLQLNFYNKSCPNAEEIINEQVKKEYEKHGNAAVSFLRLEFHDCFVGGCDASILLDATRNMKSEKAASRSFGMRNFMSINNIKNALEKECPHTVSCADIVALSASAGVILLKGPKIKMKTGRKDSTQSYESKVDESIPNINDSMSSVLFAFNKTGVDIEGTVALYGAHSVGRIHCKNIVRRLYPEVDRTLNSTFVPYLKRRCPTLDNPDEKAVEYVRNDLETPMVLDNNYYKNILKHKGLLLVDEELASDPRTRPFVIKMANDNDYFHEQFARALLILSEYNTLTGDQGEVRKDCRRVNR